MKKFLLGLFIVGLSFIGFSFSYFDLVDTLVISDGGWPTVVQGQGDLTCVHSLTCESLNDFFVSFDVEASNGQYRNLLGSNLVNGQGQRGGLGICSTGDVYVFKGGNCDVGVDFYEFISEDECITGENWSALYINDIQHLSTPLINISIPDYITWDYSVNDDQFDLYVGSGYDVEYIESIIDINSYRPTSDDFTSVFVGGLTLIMPYIIFVLFLLFIRKLVKRIFK